ncbi:MAG: Rieske 2Fe-2S domain-containing protein [Halioglobus sp.]
MAKAVDYNLGPNTFPRGWFIVAESKELDEGPMAVRFWGQDLALYRGESGNPVLLDAHCSHMGTHLTASTSAMIVKNGEQLEGESIRCPYHGWRYGPDGHVDDIPYSEAPYPKSASIRSYPVVDSMGCVMAWYDPDGADPEYDVPTVPEWDNPQWVQWELDHLGELPIHPQEILDNMTDVRHLGPTHGAPSEYFQNEIKDHVLIQRQGGAMQLYDTFLYTSTWYTGPGILFSKQVFADNTIHELIANTPVDDGVVKCWHACLYKGSENPASETDREAAKAAQAGALEAFGADFNIWANKRPALKIMQLKTDGPFRTGRKWYQQFYEKPEGVGAIREEVNGIHSTVNMATPAEANHNIDDGLPF